MKKIILASLFFLVSVASFGQGYKVDFHLDDDGSFVRTDSEKNYYVFEYGENMDAEELRGVFYNKWYYLHRLPPYFDWPFIHSNFDKETGVISGRTPVYRGLEDVAFNYSFKIQFRDGRVRIDAPKISVVDEGDLLQWDLLQWINTRSTSVLFSGQAKDAKKNLAYGLANFVINSLLSYVETDDSDIWSDPKPLGEINSIQFSLDENGSFLFPDKSISTIYEIKGMTKSQLQESFGNNCIELENKKFYYSIGMEWNYMDGACYYITGVQKMTIPGRLGLMKDKCSIEYKSFIRFEDDMVKVWAPKVTKVTIHYDNTGKESYFYSFKRFLDFFAFYNKDGSFNKKKQETVNEINRLLNLSIFAPLYMTAQIFEAINAPEEEW